MGKKFYTLIVAHHATARLHKIKLSHYVLYTILFFAAIGMISAVIMTSTYIRMAVKTRDYNQLRKDKETLKSENENLKVQTAQISEKLSSLETLAKRLDITSGRDQKALQLNVGGIGGFSETPITLNSIDRLKSNMAQLEVQLRRLDEYYTDRMNQMASMPSLWPVRGYITGGFGLREDPLSEGGQYHVGVDISTPYGNRVVAPADGLVIFAEPKAGYGNVIVINHGFGITSRYGHLSKFAVKAGDRVKRGDVIGYVGNTGRSTGPHLHYEVRVHDNPVNPLRYMKG